MKSLSVALTALVAAAVALAQSPVDESAKYIQPEGSPGFYHGKSSAAVTLDQHSILLNGKRQMIFSGEFHPFRLPAPELWKDVLEKFKAGGFNGVSVYWHWGLSAPNSQTVRFTEHNDLERFYKVAAEVGVYVIVRPGPYVNAETAGGGIPGWATNTLGRHRTNATDYREAWLPYIAEFSKVTSRFQYPDGPVIAVQSENEFYTSQRARIPGLDEHMQDIINVFHENGLTKIPTIHNDRNPAGQYAAKGLGKVDLYGWDGYPLGFDCDQPERWNELSTQHDANHQRYNPAEPLALYEWQGGAFSYWSGPSYQDCYALINEQFANVYYKNNYAAGTAIQNLYMTYGGTNWGNMHTHTIYSSYDYGAAIAEDRTLTPKFAELKLQGYFLHASPDYLLVGRIGNGTVGNGTPYSDSTDIYTTHLHSPKSDANFYVVRQRTNTKLTDTDFKLRANVTGSGELTIPKTGSLTLAGRESKIIVSNYPFGKGSRLAYSTAEVATWETFDGIDTILLYSLEGQDVEVAVVGSENASVARSGSTSVTSSASGNLVTFSGTVKGTTIFTLGKTKVIITDKRTASGVWAPHLSPGSGDAHYDITPSTPSVWVLGAYFVRSASLQGSQLQLRGDINGTTTLEIYAPSAVKDVSWNGKRIQTTRTSTGTLTGEVAFPKNVEAAKIPVLRDLKWQAADSLPELKSGFDDSDWVVANKTSTNRPQKPRYGKNILYSSEYGFHSGQWVWRGHFSGEATGVKLAIQGGFSFGYTAFINGHFLGSGEGSSHSQQGVYILEPTFNFTAQQLQENNVLTVIHDSTGMNQDYNIDDELKEPRGIRGYQLLSNNGLDFTTWKVAGNYGGENAPDHVRGPYNEGGWWFERTGAHLPGYSPASKEWKTATPYDGITAPGVTVYRTTFNLNLPREADIPLAFDFELDKEQPHRVLIYVNGWQFGRFLSSLGPQTSYPIPEGILNHHGKNEVLISLWALNEGGAKLKKLDLVKRTSLLSSKDAKVNVVKALGYKELRSNQ